jgi:AraC-like DNA-binding protein
MKMWQTIRGTALGRHSHEEPYAALILSCSYEEAGDQGRCNVGPGDVILHDWFEAHLDRFSLSGAQVLNLRLSATHSFTPCVAQIPDMDHVVRTAERSQSEAVELLLHQLQQKKAAFVDWPDELAASLIENPSLKLSAWAEAKSLAPWAVSRGFSQVFGISPEAFRARARARQAWSAIRSTTSEPLSTLASRLGFSDQSHMTRSVKQLTGASPKAWQRAANRFKT